jgi:three-Cys-motif partner protein
MGNDREHFDDYREQTRVKHEILTAYLPAYYHILKGRNENLVFIDGFAGPGTYTKAETGQTFDGSPLRALRLIASNKDFAERVSSVFIEHDAELFHALEKNVREFYLKNPEIREPKCLFGTFSERVNEIISQVGGKLAPTFLFVDPCGVSGASFETIAAVMACDKCEAFIFFNIDGVRRIAGLNELSDVLVELMGTRQRAQTLYDDLRKTTKVWERERMIVSHYRRAIVEDIGARYVIAFRVEHEEQNKTSHYFIHATKHPLGFSIMKDVMWRRGHSEDQPGALELRQRSRTNFTPLFNLEADEIKDRILNALTTRPLPASTFYQDWVRRPDDVQCESSYRKLLLELEKQGRIEILSKDGKSVTTAATRPRSKGKPTLSKERVVRLKV